ncbi:unnamed protein product [Symbiodinium microadriaticum]|nr:unnamed protein product [Symbiodinium microadriaticum]
MPEIHIDPTKNRWRYYIDTSYYGGMLDKSHEDFYRYIMMYPTLAFFFHCVWCRIKDNDKDNFLAKWRAMKRPADAEPAEENGQARDHAHHSDLWQLPIKELKARLESQGSSITGVTEKTELILMLEQLSPAPATESVPPFAMVKRDAAHLQSEHADVHQEDLHPPKKPETWTVVTLTDCSKELTRGFQGPNYWARDHAHHSCLWQVPVKDLKVFHILRTPLLFPMSAGRVLALLKLAAVSAALRHGSVPGGQAERQQPAWQTGRDLAWLNVSQPQSASMVDIGKPDPYRLIDSVFWSAKGTAMRRFADAAMPWYLKRFGTASDRREYLFAVNLRWLSENRVKAASAAVAVVAGSTAVAYWYHKSRVRARALQQARQDMEKLSTEEAVLVAEKAEGQRLEDEALWSAQALILAAAMRGDCEVRWWRSKVSLSEKEIVQYLRRPQESVQACATKGPMLARCYERPVQQLSWTRAEELVPQLSLLGIQWDNYTALAE